MKTLEHLEQLAQTLKDKIAFEPDVQVRIGLSIALIEVKTVIINILKSE